MSRMKGQSFLVATSGKRMPPTLKRSRILEIKARNRWGKIRLTQQRERGASERLCAHTRGQRQSFIKQQKNLIFFLQKLS